VIAAAGIDFRKQGVTVTGSLRKRDLATLRDECVAGLGTGQNRFELMIVPLTGVTEADLPTGFANAVRSSLKLGKADPIWPRHFNLLPYFVPALPTKQPSKVARHQGVISGWYAEDRPSYHVVPADGGAAQLGVMLRTDSRRDNGGKLSPTEANYVEFMQRAGGLLKHHKIIADGGREKAWLTFLAEFVWKHQRPTISHPFAPIGNLWEVSLAALDRLQGDAVVPQGVLPEATAPEAAAPKPTPRGPKRKPLTVREEHLLAMFDKGWGTQFKTYNDLTDAAGHGWDAVSADRFIRRIRRQRERGRKSGS
jgi:hypothetical protein